MRLLVVEDEADLRESLARVLVDAHFAVDEAADGEDGLFRALEIEYDGIVLDRLLPRRSGDAVLAALRAAGRTTPVLLLTALDAVEDRVAGLDRGADDYLTKPFAVDELVARLRALIRRAAGTPTPAVVVGDVAVDLTRRRVHRGGGEVELTSREFDLLEVLVMHRGRVMSRAALADHLYAEDRDLLSNAIDVHVASLRRKLGADLVQTRRGLGYLVDA
ncbi:MAG TPA: response regulator transcription factor [Vicinamibacterales bacterium]|jgi:two-component system OmpR family response regulator|nr:response regulator transcription factor [Vicinamibacterales bacterium]